MLITFDAEPTMEMKIHGPFNNWEGESMTYNKKMKKFEAYMPVTKSLLFKFTKNGEWVLGDYDVVVDKEGNKNHQVLFNEKPGMLKRLGSTFKNSMSSKSKDSTETIEETVAEKPTTEVTSAAADAKTVETPVPSKVEEIKPVETTSVAMEPKVEEVPTAIEPKVESTPVEPAKPELAQVEETPAIEPVKIDEKMDEKHTTQALKPKKGSFMKRLKTKIRKIVN